MKFSAFLRWPLLGTCSPSSPFISTASMRMPAGERLDIQTTVYSSQTLSIQSNLFTSDRSSLSDDVLHIIHGDILGISVFPFCWGIFFNQILFTVYSFELHSIFHLHVFAGLPHVRQLVLQLSGDSL